MWECKKMVTNHIKAFLLWVFLLLAFGEWVDLSDEELRQWYTPADLCVMRSTSRAGYPQKVRSEECKEFTGGSANMRCGVGLGSNKQPCFSPFGEARPSFRRGWKGYTNASETPLTDAFRNVVRANATVVFLGDSTTRQKLVGLECDLLRENPNHKFIGSVFGILPCHTELEVQLEGVAQSIPIHVMAIGPSSVNCLKGGLGAKGHGGGILEQATHVISKLNDEGRNLLVIANMGLWYNAYKGYRSDMQILFEFMRGLAAESKVQNVVAFHETMRQHWVNPLGSGYFHKQYVDLQEDTWKNGMIKLSAVPDRNWQVPNCCVRITNSSQVLDWRNDVSRELYHSEAFRDKKILYFPFGDITRDIADMHVCHQDFKHDCTHYCYWPLLWQPLWHQLAWASSKFRATLL